MIHLSTQSLPTPGPAGQPGRRPSSQGPRQPPATRRRPLCDRGHSCQSKRGPPQNLGSSLLPLRRCSVPMANQVPRPLPKGAGKAKLRDEALHSGVAACSKKVWEPRTSTAPALTHSPPARGPTSAGPGLETCLRHSRRCVPTSRSCESCGDQTRPQRRTEAPRPAPWRQHLGAGPRGAARGRRGPPRILPQD